MGSAIFATSVVAQNTAFASSGGNGNYPGMTGKFSLSAKKDPSASRRASRQRREREAEDYAGTQILSGRMGTIEDRANALNRVVNGHMVRVVTTVGSTREVAEHLTKALPMTVGILTAEEGEGGVERSFSLSKTGNILVVTDTNNPQIRFTNMDPITGEFSSLDGTFHSRVLTNMKYGQF